MSFLCMSFLDRSVSFIKREQPVLKPASLARAFVCVTLLVFVGTLFPEAIQAGTSNSLMDVSADGQLLICSNRDSGTVSVVDLKSGQLLKEIPVGQHPEGVTFLGASHLAAVAVYADDVICLLDLDAGSVLHRIDVKDEPYGLITNPSGDKLYVTLEYPGEIAEIDVSARQVVRSVPAGRFLRGLALDAQQRLLTTEYYTGIVKAINLETFEVVDEWKGSEQENLARQIVAHPTRNKAYLPLQVSAVEAHQGDGSIFPYLVVVDTDRNEEKSRYRKRVQMDSFYRVHVVANPWEIALSPDGETLYIVFSGTNDMFAAKVLDDDYYEVEHLSLIRTGSNPRAVKVSPDGKQFYVYNALDFTVDTFSTNGNRKISSVQVTNWSGTEEELLGKKLFYTALPPMSQLKWISCSSCHPDGDSDMRVWQQPEGLRNTQALFGMALTHPIHWSADRDEVHDFEHTIRSKLMGGRGLIRGEVNDSLGEPNAGKSKELDALAAYANSHKFKPSPYSKSGLTDSAMRGKVLFFDKNVGCAECHSGSVFTDLKVHDVGTGREDRSELMGTKYDTPTLLGVYRTAPYLHDGVAKTLEEVFTKYNPADEHGKTTQLSAAEIQDLVEYLKALPYDLP